MTIIVEFRVIWQQRFVHNPLDFPVSEHSDRIIIFFARIGPVFFNKTDNYLDFTGHFGKRLQPFFIFFDNNRESVDKIPNRVPHKEHFRENDCADIQPVCPFYPFCGFFCVVFDPSGNRICLREHDCAVRQQPVHFLGDFITFCLGQVVIFEVFVYQICEFVYFIHCTSLFVNNFSNKKTKLKE